jgi:hypothetical protein
VISSVQSPVCDLLFVYSVSAFVMALLYAGRGLPPVTFATAACDLRHLSKLRSLRFRLADDAECVHHLDPSRRACSRYPVQAGRQSIFGIGCRTRRQPDNPKILGVPIMEYSDGQLRRRAITRATGYGGGMNREVADRQSRSWASRGGRITRPCRRVYCCQAYRDDARLFEFVKAQFRDRARLQVEHEVR